jgi:hypothetical protein
MKFPDFIPAKREDVPDYVRAEYLQAKANSEAAEQERLAKQDRANNIQAVGGGVMNAAQMDLGEGKTPLSMALRGIKNKMSGPSPDQGMGGDKLVGKPGASSSTLGPVPSSASLQSPSYMASPQGQGMDIAGALRNPAGDNWQTPGTRPPAPGPAPAPAPAGGGGAGGAVPPAAGGGGGTPDFLGGTGLDATKAMSNPTPVAIPPKMPPTLPSGMQIPTGPGAQAATKGVESAVQAPVAANIASKGATEAVGKGMGGAFTQMGGAAVPGAGAAIGAIPAALRGDTMGAVKGGVGGAASSTLMAAGPAMAAAGPVGWAGMAGLAALSLYGMLG